MADSVGRRHTFSAMFDISIPGPTDNNKVGAKLRAIQTDSQTKTWVLIIYRDGKKTRLLNTQKW